MQGGHTSTLPVDRRDPKAKDQSFWANGPNPVKEWLGPKRNRSGRQEGYMAPKPSDQQILGAVLRPLPCLSNRSTPPCHRAVPSWNASRARKVLGARPAHAGCRAVRTARSWRGIVAFTHPRTGGAHDSHHRTAGIEATHAINAHRSDRSGGNVART